VTPVYQPHAARLFSSGSEKGGHPSPIFHRRFAMTNDIISIPISTLKIADQKTKTINARDLHGFLGVGRDFSNWIKGRIEEYGFLENQDFSYDSGLAKIGERETGATRRIEYRLTLDMAKELCMIEKTERGKQARKYFIACERAVKGRRRTQQVIHEDLMARRVLPPPPPAPDQEPKPKGPFWLLEHIIRVQNRHIEDLTKWYRQYVDEAVEYRQKYYDAHNRSVELYHKLQALENAKATIGKLTDELDKIKNA
jgi:phage anti-repressor protein